MRILSKIGKFSENYRQNFANFGFGAVQRFLNLVDLEKCGKMRILEILDIKIGVDTADNEPSKVL